MNFFAHYYFDHTEDAAFNTGLILPDLLRNFVNERIPFSTLNFDPPSPENSILQGSSTHVIRDRDFHQSEFFIKSNAKLIELIKLQGYAEHLPRYWFLAHIMVELCLDSVLIEKEPPLLKKFYLDLENTRQQTALPTFLNFIEEGKVALFLSRFDRFLEAKYLFSYTDPSKLTFALNMISKRAGIIGDYDKNQTDAVNLLSMQARELVQTNFYLLNS